MTEDAYYRPFLLWRLASVYTKIGEHNLALDQLEHLLSTPGGTSAALLRQDPEWDALRDNPRFKRLVEEHSQTGSQLVSRHLPELGFTRSAVSGSGSRK